MRGLRLLADTAQVVKTGETVSGGWDPAENKLYTDEAVAVAEGDALLVRGALVRVTAVQRWTGAGAVVVCEPQTVLPDTAILYRLVGGVTFDRATNVSTGPQRTQLWSGHVKVEPASSESSAVSAAANAEQQITTQTFRVTLPLEVVDIHPDDVLHVTQSADPWLTAPADLTVSRVLGGTDAVQREVLAVLNEG